MIDQSIIEKIRESFRIVPKESLTEKGEGWVNLARFAPVVNNAGVNYKELGYKKFGDFIAESKLFVVWTDLSGAKPVKYIKEKDYKELSSRDGNTLSKNKTSKNSIEAEKIKKRLRLENNQFIGQLTPQKNDGWYFITDIRNTDFTKIEDKERGIKNPSIVFKSLNKEFKKFTYYKFTWVLLDTDPIKFGIDLHEEIIPIDSKDIVKRIHDGIMRYPAGAAKKIASSLDTLRKQLTQSGKEVFIYELLQNANDYPRHIKRSGKNINIPVEVEFHITRSYLAFQHTGELFNPKNIAAICDINDGEKADNTEAIGYKGIGFKTVFLDNDYVLLNTGNYSFRFDKSATDVINTPWQILPVWTEYSEIDSEIKSVFLKHPNDEFRVKFALQPRDKNILTDKTRDDNYIALFNNVFDSERVILFIPNIKKVSIFLEGQQEPIIREKDSKAWCVSDSLVDDIPEDITEKINDVLNNPDSLRSDGYEKIPEKYLNFKKTAVKFACKKEGRRLKKVDDAILYCYLPAKRADWGFDFLMNTDMVPNGQRDDIEDIELNHVIARIAGKKFFYWIKQLIETKEYDLDSIFALIPNFNECKKRRGYKKFIEEFQEEFENLLKIETFVPTLKDREYTLIHVGKIIYDTTSISLSGIMSDEELLSFVDGAGDWNSNPDEFFAHKDVRGKENFLSFLSCYRAAGMEFSQTTILSLCNSDKFNQWLKIEKNNHNFLNFLLTNNHLQAFLKAKKKIFKGNDGVLYSADEIYENIDEVYKYIPMFGKYIPHLSDYTRSYFVGNGDWQDVTNGCFKPFLASDMITSYILPKENAMELLNEPKNSVAFYRYLSAKDINLNDNSYKVPYITEDGKVSTDYENHQYFYNADAYTLTQAEWLGLNVINVLSHNYFEGVCDAEKKKLKALFSRIGFAEFNKDSFISKVIVGDTDFCANVNATINGDYATNKAFVDYVFGSDVQLKEYSLKEYVLRCVDLNGNDIYLCNDDVRYFDQDAFAQNSTYDDNTHHEWLQDGMMYSLSNTYFDGLEKDDSKKLESFLRQQFGIKTFTDKSFFTDVVIKNKSVIYARLVDKGSMLAFLDYLKRDAERLFDGSLSFNDIKDMPLLAYDGTVVNSREANIQYVEYNDDAKTLCEKPWCPKVFVLLARNYNDDFSQDVRQLFKIAKFDINVISDIFVSKSLISKSLCSTDQNIDFWRWVKDNQKPITSIEKFKNLPLLNKSNVLTYSSLLYISDTYQQDQIESLVTRYVKSAQFVSSAYIETTNEKEKAEWMMLFKKIGLKSDNKDILFSDILPNLVSFEEDSVVAMMTKHIKDLKERWSERKPQIIKLRVRTRSGEYKTLDQVTIVNVDVNVVSEPFIYISLPNEIHPDILKANKELLLLISAEYGNCNIITKKQAWIEAKVKDYLAKFAADNNSVDDIHVQFVREVAKIQSEYDIDKNLRKQIKYRVKSTEILYKSGQELSLATEYSPACDFEKNGVTDLLYLSPMYIFEGNKDIIKSYFKTEGLHHNMTQKDIKYLANREFACYFWSSCFSRRLVEYGAWIEEGCFKNKVCIPTENSIQKPEDLYAPKIAGYAVRARAPQWENKVPCKAIVDSIESRDARDLFEKLNFRNELSFEDCLYYLARVTHQREDETHYRRTVIEWLLSSPNQEETTVDNYRKTPTAKWRNGKGQMRHISELYAIHPDATQERNIFRGDEFVMQTSAFPYDTDSFVKVCEILKIKCLTSTDFIATPIGKHDETVEMVAMLRPRLLILSAIENPDRFQELYERYNEKLSKYHFVVCEKIDLGYDTIHNDVERIYNDDNHLYYVSSWKHNRTFTKFCNKFKRLIGFDVYDNVCEDILDDSITVEACIEKYCSALAYNDKFQSYLKSLDLAINIVPDEEVSSTSETEYYGKAIEKSADPIEDEPHNTTKEYVQNIYSGAIAENKTPMVQDKGNGVVTSESDISKKTETPNSEKLSFSSTKHQMEEGDTLPADSPSAQTVAQQPNTESLSQPTKTTIISTNKTTKDIGKDPNQIDTYTQVQEDEKAITDGANDDGNIKDDHVQYNTSNTNRPSSLSSNIGFNPDHNDYMGSVEKDNNYQPVGDRPYKPHIRKHPKPFTKDELERLRSNGTPLQLESLPPTEEEIDLLAQCNIKPEQIADTNYLAQLRLYLNLTREMHEEPEETMEEFVRNADDVTVHKLKGDERGSKYIHTCSAVRGVMYVSPSVWNKMVDDRCKICVYLDGQGKNFHYIETVEDFLKLVEKDDVVIKITGKEKVKVVNALYTDLLEGARGTAYTLIRVAARTNMDAVFAHYVGAMAEVDDGNEDNNEYGE